MTDEHKDKHEHEDTKEAKDRDEDVDRNGEKEDMNCILMNTALP